MTLDEAIKHTEEVAEENEKSLRGWKECKNRGTEDADRQGDRPEKHGARILLISRRTSAWMQMPVFRLSDQPTLRVFPSHEDSDMVRISSPITAAGPYRNFTGFPSHQR